MPFGCFAFCHAFCKGWRQSSRQPPLSCQATKISPFRLPGPAQGQLKKKVCRSLGNPHSKISVACQSTGCLCLGSPAGSFGLRDKVLRHPHRTTCSTLPLFYYRVALIKAPSGSLFICHTCKIGCTRSGRKSH